MNFYDQSQQSKNGLSELIMERSTRKTPHTQEKLSDFKLSHSLHPTMNKNLAEIIIMTLLELKRIIIKNKRSKPKFKVSNPKQCSKIFNKDILTKEVSSPSTTKHGMEASLVKMGPRCQDTTSPESLSPSQRNVHHTESSERIWGKDTP